MVGRLSWLARLLALAQAALAVRVVWRLLRTGGEHPLQAAAPGLVQPGAVAIVVPVLNESGRLATCLDGVLAQGEEVGEIVVVDGGSTDGTPDLARAYARRDPRVRLLVAGPAPRDWNGKVWGLHAGEQAIRSNPDWVLTLDADVRPAPLLARSLVAGATVRGLRLLSVAAAQSVSGPAEGLIHPALLATLVYRFGRPGGTTHTPSAALANGQCCLIRRDLLHQLGGFQAARASLSEDITLARLAAMAGDRVGFYEADGLITVSMYADWRDAWQNWPRSLATRDALFGLHGWLGLAEILLVQALPLPLFILGHARRLNLVLLAVRLGMLAGMARAYTRRPSTYWLSPLVDLPAALAVWRSAVAPRHAWRGRTYAREKGLLVTP